MHQLDCAFSICLQGGKKLLNGHHCVSSQKQLTALVDKGGLICASRNLGDKHAKIRKYQIKFK